MKSKKTRYTILVVDDDPFIRRLVKRTFKNTIFDVVDVDSSEEAMNSIDINVPDLILLDLKLPGMEGAEFAGVLKKQSIDTPILVISGKGDASTVKSLASLGVVGYIKKPFDLQDLNRRVAGAIIDWRAKRGYPISLDFDDADQVMSVPVRARQMTSLVEKFNDRLGEVTTNIDSLAGDVEILRIDLQQFKSKLEMLVEEVLLLKGQGS